MGLGEHDSGAFAGIEMVHLTVGHASAVADDYPLRKGLDPLSNFRWRRHGTQFQDHFVRHENRIEQLRDS